MKTVVTLALLVATTLLTGCAQLWMITYRAKGGYYDRKIERPAVRTENAR